MELFISDAQPEDTLSLALELFCVYVRAPQREIVNLNVLSPATLAALKLGDIPLLLKSVSKKQPDGQMARVEEKLTNPFTILLEIAKAAYLEDILFKGADSMERTEIGMQIETVGRLKDQELADYINGLMAQKMFVVSENITAADFIVFAALAPWFSQLKDHEKLALPHAFRWIDHIQNLPGMLHQV